MISAEHLLAVVAFHHIFELSPLVAVETCCNPGTKTSNACDANLVVEHHDDTALIAQILPADRTLLEIVPAPYDFAACFAYANCFSICR